MTVSRRVQAFRQGCCPDGHLAAVAHAGLARGRALGRRRAAGLTDGVEAEQPLSRSPSAADSRRGRRSFRRCVPPRTRRRRGIRRGTGGRGRCMPAPSCTLRGACTRPRTCWWRGRSSSPPDRAARRDVGADAVDADLIGATAGAGLDARRAPGLSTPRASHARRAGGLTAAGSGRPRRRPRRSSTFRPPPAGRQRRRRSIRRRSPIRGAAPHLHFC